MIQHVFKHVTNIPSIVQRIPDSIGIIMLVSYSIYYSQANIYIHHIYMYIYIYKYVHTHIIISYMYIKYTYKHTHNIIYIYIYEHKIYIYWGGVSIVK